MLFTTNVKAKHWMFYSIQSTQWVSEMTWMHVNSLMLDSKITYFQPCCFKGWILFSIVLFPTASECEMQRDFDELYTPPLNTVQILTSAFFFKLCICRLCSTGKLQQVCSAAAVWQRTRAALTSQLKRIRLLVGACWYVFSVQYWTANFHTVVIHSLSLLFAPLNLHLLFTPRPRSCFLAPASMQEWEVLLGDRLAPSFQEAECGTSTLRV